MVSILVSWLILTVLVYLTAVILPGVEVKRFFDAIIVAMIFGLLNWALHWLMTIVIGVATLGLGFLLLFLTRILVMALLLKLTDAMTERIKIRSFGWAFLAALIISVGSTALEAVAHKLHVFSL